MPPYRVCVLVSPLRFPVVFEYPVLTVLWAS